MERKLSRGLDALLPKSTPESISTDAPNTIPISAIRANPRQPRHEFATEGLDELKASIATDGLLQPVVVRRVGEGFELIAGERRFRACKSLGWTQIPAIVRTARDEQQLVLALVENLQRRDLNAIEESKGYRALLDEFGITHEEIARRVGKNRTTVTNALRLLDLPDAVQSDVSRGTLSAGHARALLPLVGKAGFQAVLERVRIDELSVRATEIAVRETLEALAGNRAAARDSDRGPRRAAAGDPAIRDLEDRLRRIWHTGVHVRMSGRARSITFRCATRPEFDHLVSQLTRARRTGDASQSEHAADQ